MTSEIGRELQVSELRPKTVVFVAKDSTFVTVWVVEVSPYAVHFRASAVKLEFLARRTGPGLEEITDDSDTPLRIFEYLGEV